MVTSINMHLRGEIPLNKILISINWIRQTKSKSDLG